MEQMRAFYRRIGLPLNLQQLGLPRAPTEVDIDTLATLTLTAPHIRNFNRVLTAHDLSQAISALEAATH